LHNSFSVAEREDTISSLWTFSHKGCDKNTSSCIREASPPILRKITLNVLIKYDTNTNENYETLTILVCFTIATSALFSRFGNYILYVQPDLVNHLDDKMPLVSKM
jgi:hypothetical protein